MCLFPYVDILGVWLLNKKSKMKVRKAYIVCLNYKKKLDKVQSKCTAPQRSCTIINRLKYLDGRNGSAPIVLSQKLFVFMSC